MRHPDQAAEHLAAVRAYNRARTRRHPYVTGLLMVGFGFFYGFARWNTHSTGHRLVAGVIGGLVGLVVAAFVVWHARRVPPGRGTGDGSLT
jgi:hypothetical protein